MDLTELEARLIDSIDRRYQSHTDKDLKDYIFFNHLFHRPEASLVDFSYQHRHEIAGYLSDPNHLDSFVKYCVAATRRYTYQRNQFINLPPSYDRLLYTEYRDFFQQIGSALAETPSRQALAQTYASLLKRHHERLRLILSSYCVAAPGNDLAENPLLQTVPCEEYSASFQLRLLGIDLARLVEPVLDVGCGSGGRLVNFLRAHGIAAFGLDRLAPAESYFFETDWFSFDYSRSAWGTILAHQSLSTHFIHNHLHQPVRAERYARLYLEIVSSLAPGGAFFYAPGLPFFESHLEKTGDYSIRRTTISADSMQGIGEIFYAAKVTANH
jgi:SAM-dependent methyltransferase